jgi:protein-arginine kinase activator protein McsA
MKPDPESDGVKTGKVCPKCGEAFALPGRGVPRFCNDCYDDFEDDEDRADYLENLDEEDCDGGDAE